MCVWGGQVKNYHYINNILIHVYLCYKQITLRPYSHYFCLHKGDCQLNKNSLKKNFQIIENVIYSTQLSDRLFVYLVIYGLPKTHKDNIPVRSILSMQHKLAKWLAELLQLMLDIYMENCIKN